MAKKPTQTFTNDLKCALSPTELAKKSDELAVTVRDFQALKAEKAAQMSQMSAELKGLVAREEALSAQIMSRTEMRPVQCIRVLDAQRQRVATFRTDTHEVVDLRNMEPEEVERTRGEAEFIPEPDISDAMEQFARGMDADPVTSEGDDGGDNKANIVNFVGDPDSADTFDLTKVKGIGPKLAGKIKDHGWGSLDALRGAIVEDLEGVPGLKPALAGALLLYVEVNHSTMPKPDDDPEDLDGESEPADSGPEPDDSAAGILGIA
jgi:predicted flap endonuclease-1-like 5' DNA nuclease